MQDYAPKTSKQFVLHKILLFLVFCSSMCIYFILKLANLGFKLLYSLQPLFKRKSTLEKLSLNLILKW